MFWSKSRKQDPQADPSSIGNLLIESGYITKEQLDHAAELQQKQQLRLGEILIQMGVLTEDRLKSALMKQRVSRGKASTREELQFYQHYSREAIKEVAQKIQETADLSNELAHILEKTNK